MSGRPERYRGHGPELPERDRRFDGRTSRQPSLSRERRERERDRDYGDHNHNHQQSYRGSSISRARRSPSPRYRSASSHPPPPDYSFQLEPYRDREYRGSSRAPHRPELDRYDGQRPSSSQPRNYDRGRYEGDYSRDYYHSHRGASEHGHSNSRARRSRSQSPRRRRSRSPRRSRSRSPGYRAFTTSYSPPPRDFNRFQPPEAGHKAPSPMRKPSSSASIGELPKKAAEADKPGHTIPPLDKPTAEWRELSTVTEEVVQKAGKIATSLADVKVQISDSTNVGPNKFDGFRANVLNTRLRSRAASALEKPATPQDTILVDDESDSSTPKDDDYHPQNATKKQNKKKVNPLSLNPGRKGRGKGTKNKQDSKDKLRDDLKESQAQIETLRAAELKVDNDLKAAMSSSFSSGMKNSCHPFVGVKKAIIDNKEDLKFEMIGSAIEDRFIEQIYDGCLLPSTDTQWSDVGGLEEVKKSMKEVVIDPLRRPDIFTGLRAAPKGVLLYGPPGTGKTLIARCIASQCQSNFFNVSASKLTSKWVGDGEKTVQALFAVARAMQPSVIFIDEVDSVLSKRTEKENESSKKMKTEFLVQMEGAATKSENDQILVIGATNRPADLDEAVRRRFQKKFLIPLPDAQARLQILQATFRREKTSLTYEDYKLLADVLEGYSGADLRNVCKEAAMIPVRECGDMLDSISVTEIRPTAKEDVLCAAQKIKPTVSPKDLVHYREFDKLYGDKP